MFDAVDKMVISVFLPASAVPYSPRIAGALSNDYFKGIDFDSVFLRRYKKGTSMDIKPLLECLKVVQSLPKRFLLKDLLDELCRSFKNVHLW